MLCTNERKVKYRLCGRERRSSCGVAVSYETWCRRVSCRSRTVRVGIPVAWTIGL